MTLTVRIRDIRPGDVLVDVLGRDYFRVETVAPARARGYIVLLGASLLPRDGARTAGGFGNNTVTVRREP